MISFRPAEPRDRPFVIGAWESQLKLTHTAGFILMKNWAAVMRPQLEETLDRPYVQTIVAYNPDDPDPIADLSGFIVAEPDESPPLVYFVYVKEAQRKLGIARRLFAAAGVDPSKRFTYVCTTPLVERLARKIPLSKWTPINGRFSRERRRPR